MSTIGALLAGFALGMWFGFLLVAVLSAGGKD